MARNTFELTNVVDGCSEGNPGVAGGGGIVGDHDGPMLMAFASFSGINSNNMAEAKAILQGSSMCIDRGYLNSIVESDSMLLFDIINRKLRNPCEGKMALQTRWANLIVTEKEQIVFTEDLSLPKQVRALLKQGRDGIPNIRFKIRKNMYTND